jgi:limonene 1,2-monooxygenase
VFDRLKFGVFHPPFHLPTGRNPHLLLRRDVELVQHLDRLGFDEAWIGEHHSCGSELIGEPLMFCAHVAPQTQQISLCTGVISLPYHNPLWVADRIILADHLTKGRIKIGLGPGALTTDAHMIGLDPTTQRDALVEDVDVLMALLRSDEPVTADTARYRLQEARTQMRPYSEIEFAIAATASPTGPRIAGKHGVSLLSIGATMAAHAQDQEDLLGKMWQIYTQRCDQFGHTPNRAGWRLVGPMHVAETKEEAEAQVRHGIDAWFDYYQQTQSATHFSVAGTTTEERIAWVVESGLGVIGTPDEAIAQIDHLVAQSKGGFGAYLIMTHEWANWANTLKSYELFAEYVMPRYQGSLDSLIGSENWARERRDDLGKAQMASVQKAIDDHAAEQEPKRTDGSGSATADSARQDGGVTGLART